MRLVYLDESGISDNEPFTVVAGIIINADEQGKSVAEYLNSLLLEYVPVEHHVGFAFHAKDVFHGSNIFNPKEYPPERRRELLSDFSRYLRSFDCLLLTVIATRYR